MSQDLDAALEVAAASRGFLPPNDPWPACLAGLKVVLETLKQGIGSGRTGGVLAEAMRLHVLDAVANNLPPELRASCGQVLFELQVKAARGVPFVP